jgi:hypothetical protein
MKILKNAVYCKHCKQEIQSTATHEMVTCSGAHIAVDGGLEYLRRVFFKDNVDYTERSITQGAEAEEQAKTIPKSKPKRKKILKEAGVLEWNKPGVRR